MIGGVHQSPISSRLRAIEQAMWAKLVCRMITSCMVDVLNPLSLPSLLESSIQGLWSGDARPRADLGDAVPGGADHQLGHHDRERGAAGAGAPAGRDHHRAAV